MHIDRGRLPDVSSPTLTYYRIRSCPEMYSPLLGRRLFRECFTSKS